MQTTLLSVTNWSAFAPGLESREQWLAWAGQPFLPAGDAVPELPEMPPMQRRRVDRLGRMALRVAWSCQAEATADVPLVFASRHGDLARSYDMLQTLARGEPQSPTHFGLSTHNAIAAQYGIARRLEGNCVCVAAGAASAEAAVVEAMGLLADGVEQVLVVVYDTPLHSGYADFGDEPEAPYAWSALLRRADAAQGGVAFRLEAADAAAEASVRLLPHGLEVLRFLIGSEPSLEFRDQDRGWRWTRHG